MNEFPNRIRAHRKAKHLTLEQLSQKLDFSLQQLADMERGTRSLHYVRMVQIANALELSVADLLHDRDVPDRLRDDRERRLVELFRLGDVRQREQLARIAEIILS